jgi:serine protease Do
MTRIVWRLVLMLAVAALALTLAMSFSPESQGSAEEPLPKEHNPQIGQAFQVPYRLTDTNHFLVRVRINGKGPFNFLVDSGAPALFISTGTAKKIGLKPSADDFWTPVNRLDLEGGSRLTDIKARVEDPFQLVGMNALGLPGTSIDGILGFTILARFRLEIDLTRDRMVWTRLDHDPRDPPVPKHKPGEEQGAPAGVQAMSALGPLAKGLAFLMGKQPEEQRQPRGFLGLEWSERVGSGQKQVWVQGVLEGLPAAHGGIHIGDQIIRINGRVVEGLKDAHTALAGVHPGDSVPLVIRRGSGADAHELTLTLTAAEGL